MNTAVLEVQGLSKSFGALKVIDDFSIRVGPGERRLILGPNGAGKTTLFNLITGDLAPNAGSIRFFEKEISSLRTPRRVALGLARTFQIVTLFPNDTVLRNVVLALIGKRPLRWDPLFSLESRGSLREQARAVLNQVQLETLADKPLRATSYGEKRRLELALALAQNPRLLLLDEPLAGLSAQERVQIQQLIEQIPRTIAIIMIEHDMSIALSFAERVSLLQDGRLIIEGTRDEVVAHPRTREVYLGH
jgi:branched-chain amino acid transport system ATP-binding protein